MDSLAARIKIARHRQGMTQVALATQAGMRQAEISKLEAGAVSTTTKLVQLAHALRCDPYWLATGVGQVWGQPAADAMELDGRGGNVIGLEVKGASEFAVDGVDIDPSDDSTQGVLMGSGVHHGYAVKVIGDANAPALKDGQFVVIEEAPAREGELALFHTDDGLLLRELLRETDDAYYIDDPAWGDRRTLRKKEVSKTEAVVAIVAGSRWRRLEKPQD